MLLCAAAMVCSHCCQHTVSFLTIYLCFYFFMGFLGGVGGPTWPCVSLVPDFGAKCATSSVGYLGGGGQLGNAYLWCWTSVPSAQPPLWAI